MKVRCINKSGEWKFTRDKIKQFLGFIIGRKKNPTTGPKFGDVCTVVSDHWCEGCHYYVLKEWPKGENCGYQADQFEPIEEEYQEVKYSAIIKEKALSVN